MRYALYFSPAKEHPLTQAASAWLGRDAFTGEALSIAAGPELGTDTIHELTAEPRRYGFHATLKAPFPLHPDRKEEELISSLERFAADTPAFAIPSVVVDQLGPFFALVPEPDVLQLQEFAARVVEEFDPFRAPLSPEDMARRKPDTLSSAERENLERWGYPYVMDEFRFHMTLTGQVAPEQAARVRKEIDRRFAAFVHRPLAIDALALFIEPEPGAPFTVRRLLPLATDSANRKNAT